MYHFIMDPDRGKKWFHFYTKVRPWFAVAYGALSLLSLFVVLLVPEEFPYPFWAVVILAFRIAHAVLCVFVFAKSFGDYFDFVQFIKIVILFETIYTPLVTFIDEATNGDGLGSAVVYGLITAALYYFLWYRLNIKYFDRRLICTNPPSKEEAEQYIQNKAAEKANKEQQEYKVKTAEELLKEYSLQPTNAAPSHVCVSRYDPNAPNENEGILLQQDNKSDEPDLEDVDYEYDDAIEEDDDEVEEVKKPNFCRKCGNKLAPDSVFCSNCGTKIN